MLPELRKRDECDPDHGQKDIDDGWVEICNNLQKKYCLHLKKLQISLMKDYNLYNNGEDEDEDIPIFLYKLVQEAKARHERKNKKGIYCNVCGKKNGDCL